MRGALWLTATRVAGSPRPKKEGSAPRAKGRSLGRQTLAHRAGIVAACGCGHAVGRSAAETLSWTADHRQAVVFGVKALFTLPAHKHHSHPQSKAQARSPVPVPQS